MKTTAFFLSALLLASAAPLTAQETKSGSKAGASEKAAIEKLIEDLGNADYEVRKAAEKSLLSRGDSALEALKKTAEKHDDPEVQWRAGRLVRRIQNGESGKTDRLGKRESEKKDTTEIERPDGRPGVKDAFRDLDRLFEGFDGKQFDENMHERLEKALEQMRKSLRDFDDFGGRGFKIRPPLRIQDFGEMGSSSSRSTKISQGPDGVRVEITEKGDDGKDETKVYEAEDMESFKKKYPDVLKGGGVSIEMGDLFDGKRFRVLSPRLLRDGGFWHDGFEIRNEARDARRGARPKGLRKKADAGETEPVRSEGRKLGFYVGEISPAVRDYLELDGGLMVQSVVEDSLAEKLGVKKGDIIVRVGEKKIRTAEDVAASLEAIGDGKVTVDVIRRGRKVSLR